MVFVLNTVGMAELSTGDALVNDIDLNPQELIEAASDVVPVEELTHVVLGDEDILEEVIEEVVALPSATDLSKEAPFDLMSFLTTAYESEYFW